MEDNFSGSKFIVNIADDLLIIIMWDILKITLYGEIYNVYCRALHIQINVQIYVYFNYVHVDINAYFLLLVKNMKENALHIIILL